MNAKVFKSAKCDELIAKSLADGKSGPTLVAKDEGLGYGMLFAHLKDRQPKPEMHEAADDVYYILEGQGTLYIGGKIADGVQKTPGEWTGRTIEGAETVAVAKGDVVSIPRGNPHMMGCPGGQVKYFVVKVW